MRLAAVKKLSKILLILDPPPHKIIIDAEKTHDVGKKKVKGHKIEIYCDLRNFNERLFINRVKMTREKMRLHIPDLIWNGKTNEIVKTEFTENTHFSVII